MLKGILLNLKLLADQVGLFPKFSVLNVRLFLTCKLLDIAFQTFASSFSPVLSEPNY